MRVLLVPEIYRTPASACGTLQDAILWVEDWLDRDPHLHVYWLLPPAEEAGYEPEDVHANAERVTLIEAEDMARSAGGSGDRVLTDAGYAGAQLDALRGAIHERGGYVDVVVDQLRAGRFALRQWLLALGDNPWAGQLPPFEIVANVHDLQLARKHRGCAHRDPAQGELEVVHAALADGIWFTAGVDAEGWRRRAHDLLRSSLVEDAWQQATTIASPLELSSFEERYAEEPSTLHLAGSFWEKKRTDRLLAVAEHLHAEHGVETVLTSMDPLPETIPEAEWLEAHGQASRATYRRALEAGDVAVCASSYETMARTPFEQAASGQVLLARQAPWIRECIPEGHPLVAPLDALDALASAVVEDWANAVAANRRLVHHLRCTRSPQRVGERTHRDLRARVDARLRRFEAPSLVARVEEATEAVGTPARLDAVLAYDGEDGSLAEREDVTRTDVVHALRVAGFADRARSPTPRFAPLADDRRPLATSEDETA